MQSALFTGISGINAHMGELSVIGNNIANVNTIGFKNSRVTFADVLSQTLTGGSGTNQIGLGVMMNSIQKVFSQGAFETTSNSLDMAISGNGFFIVQDPTLNTEYYSRAGQFQSDKDGYIVNPDGLRLKGYMANTSGTLQNTVSDLMLSQKTISPNATADATFNANLDSNSPVIGYVFTLGSNDSISFDVGGGPLTANLITQGGLASGTAFTGGEAAAAIKAALETANGIGDTYTVDYNDQTGLFTITNDSGNGSPLNITWAASNSVLGFTPGLMPIAVGASGASSAAGGAFNLSTAGDTANFSTPVTVYDSLGNAHAVTMYFRKDSSSAAGNSWEWFAVVDGSDSTSGATELQAEGSISFSANGALNTESAITYLTASGGFEFTGGAAQGQMIGIDFGTSIAQGGTGTDGTTQYASSSGVSALTQDGYASGTLQRADIDQDGTISGIFTNGRSLTLGQVLLADFASPTSLSSAGKTVFSETYDSGQPLIGAPGSSGRGLIQSSTLEMSNVDIAEEFVKMITAQRGFQANSKVITTTDELLAELVNLKR
ncbi:MAG: flagellar hook protein FlgE [Deltaproteobacteria bacterium]|nr:flagellar hook protein FlgE [Deltaproteobacteria bacterium]